MLLCVCPTMIMHIVHGVGRIESHIAAAWRIVSYSIIMVTIGIVATRVYGRAHDEQQ